MPSSESPESLKITSESELKSENSTPQMTPNSLTLQTTVPGNTSNETADASSAQLTRTPHSDIIGHDGAKILSGKNRTSLDHFEKAAGGREGLIDTLSLSSLDKKQEHLLRLLCDPRRAHDSLATITRDAGLLPSHVIELFRTASVAKGSALAIAQFSESLPAIAKDITDKSIDAKVECPSCFGEKYIEDGVKCPQCLGKGEIFRASDLDRQKIALESVGVTKKGGGVSVNVNQQVGVVSPNTFFSKYVKASDQAAYDVDGFVDADIQDAHEDT